MTDKSKTTSSSHTSSYCSFGNRDWIATAKHDPAVPIKPQLTLAAGLAIMEAGTRLRSQGARDWGDLPLLMVHGQHDGRAQCSAVQQFVDEAQASASGASNGSRRSVVEGYFVPDTTGHQLLQDHRVVTERVKDKIATWMVEQIQQHAKQQQQQHKASSVS